MKKLKDILSEAYAWERKEGKPLPTLAEVQAEYQRNEAANDAKAKVAKLEKDLANLKHQYYSDPNMTDEKSQKLRKQMGPIVRELKRAKREDRTGSAGYKNSKPDFLDLDNDGDKKEPMKAAAKDVNEIDVSVDAKPGKGKILILASNGLEISTDDAANMRDDGKIKVATIDKAYNAIYFNQTITVTGATKTQAYEIVDENSFREMLKDANQRQQFGADVSLDQMMITESIDLTLRNNLRRFGVKNLKENAFEGEPIEPEGDTVTVYQSKYDMVNLSVNGQMRQLLWMDKGKSLQQVLSLAREEDAYLPTRDELDSLQKSIKPGELVGEIWIDQGPSAPANMQYVLFNLSDSADVMVVNQGQGPRDTYSQHVVLLRKTPMKRPVTVSPKR